MAEQRIVSSTADPYDLARFVRAQEPVYDRQSESVQQTAAIGE